MKKTAIILTLLVCMVFCTTACQKDGTPSGSVNRQEPEETVRIAIDALQQADAQTFHECVEFPTSNIWFGPNLDGDSKDYIAAVFEELQYNILATETGEDTATVHVEIKNKDLSNVSSNLADYADANNALVAAIQNASGQVEKSVYLPLKKTDTGWVIEITDDFTVAVSGGYWSATPSNDNKAMEVNTDPDTVDNDYEGNYSFRDIEPGQYAASEEIYEVAGGKLSYHINWQAMGNPIEVGLLNTEDNSLLTVPATSGRSISEIEFPSGTYKVVVVNPADNNSDISGVIAFEWE